eukprot:scaffold25064_cov23-Tisochrysis_lutea.AAC.3
MDMRAHTHTHGRAHIPTCAVLAAPPPCYSQHHRRSAWTSAKAEPPCLDQADQASQAGLTSLRASSAGLHRLFAVAAAGAGAEPKCSLAEGVAAVWVPDQARGHAHSGVQSMHPISCRCCPAAAGSQLSGPLHLCTFTLKSNG